MATAHALTLPGIDPAAPLFCHDASNDGGRQRVELRPDPPGSTGTIGFGTVAGAAPVVAPPVADGGIVVTSTRTPPAWAISTTPDGGVQMSQPDDSDASSHKVTLGDLVGGTHYTCHYHTDWITAMSALDSANFDVNSRRPSPPTRPGMWPCAPTLDGITGRRQRHGDGAGAPTQRQPRRTASSWPSPWATGAQASSPASASGVTGANGQYQAQFTITDIPPPAN